LSNTSVTIEMASATFILSLDTEIAWGTYSAPGSKASAFDTYPALLRRLVNLLDIYEISATWAVVGALIDPQPDALPPVHYPFASAPDTERVQRGPAHWFHLPAVLDCIQRARAPQEIATHTYTHLLSDAPAVSRERFAAELRAARDLHAKLGLPPLRSLVYPQNRVAHVDVLGEFGITSYRGPAEDWYSALPRPLSRPAHLLDRSLGFPPPVYRLADCDRTHDVVNLPASQFLMSYDGVRASIPTESRVRQALTGLDRAAEHNAIFHLWFHPFNLGSADAMFDALTTILAQVYERRSAGTLRVLTMEQAAVLVG
jgi:peptidoglycan/xylan/chitin deacetylase (PgdA/CDA1 family)